MGSWCLSHIHFWSLKQSHNSLHGIVTETEWCPHGWKYAALQTNCRCGVVYYDSYSRKPVMFWYVHFILWRIPELFLQNLSYYILNCLSIGFAIVVSFLLLPLDLDDFLHPSKHPFTNSMNQQFTHVFPKVSHGFHHGPPAGATPNPRAALGRRFGRDRPERWSPWERRPLSCWPKERPNPLHSIGANGRYMEIPLVNQGLVNVPFWEYWTSPYSSHYRPYT